MSDRLEVLDLLDAYFAAATMAHEYADDLHYKLATLQADDLHTRKLLADSADVVLREMPRLVRELRGLTRQMGRASAAGSRTGRANCPVARSLLGVYGA